MTRLLILGNSHAAALRRAFPALTAAHPDMDLCFWGLPGGAFAKARTGPDGLLRPDPTDRISLRKAAHWGIAPEIDLTAFDQIFLVGLRFNLQRVHSLLHALQPLDLGRRPGALGVSDSLLRAALRAEVDSCLAAQMDRTPLGPQVTLMPAPYPAAAVTQTGSPLYEPLTAGTAALPDAAALMALYEAEITAGAARHGLRLALQPRATLATAFLSADRYLDDPTRDGRHLNADYGRLAFRALLDAAPLSPSAAPAAPITA